MAEVPAFKLDPLLSRAMPQGPGGFDVLSLLAPARPAFRHDPVISAAAAAVEAALACESALRQQEEANAAARAAAGEPGPVDGSASPQVPASLQEQLEQHYRQGVEDGLAQAARLAAEAREQALSEAGGELALSAPTAAHGAEPQDLARLVESLTQALQPLLEPEETAVRFEPLKRLALHLAMELVRMELSVSPAVVEGLVLRCVQALQSSPQASLVVELHPADLAVLRAALEDGTSPLSAQAQLLERIQWKEDGQLARGSVRAAGDASTVEDLIENRLMSIISELRIEAQQWQRDESEIQRRAAHD